MSNRSSVLRPDDDPYKILRVCVEADDREIRAAYLREVKANPPDRSPAQFERVRDAYALLRDPEGRIQWRLFSVDPDLPLVRLLEGESAQRRHVGPGPWLAYLARCPARAGGSGDDR